MNFYKRHIGDYIKDTSHLSLLEHGIYTRLLDVYYTREQALPPFDQTARLIGARSDDERAALRCVLDEFFTESDAGFRQERCEREIEVAAAAAERSREVGKKGGRPRKGETQQVSAENPAGYFQKPTDNPSQTPDTRHQTPEEKRTPRAARTASPKKSAIPDDFTISARVAEWAASNGHGQLIRHLEHFRSACKAKGYTYADWDEAFMGAIRKDWAGLSVPQARASPAAAKATARSEFMAEFTGRKPPQQQPSEVIDVEFRTASPRLA